MGLHKKSRRGTGLSGWGFLMNERDEHEAKYANLQFHLKKVTLAKAALAGVTYKPVAEYVPGRFDHKGPREYRMAYTTAYIAVLPDGAHSTRSFADELEAAIWALAILDPPAHAKPIEGFVLNPENEQ